MKKIFRKVLSLVLVVSLLLMANTSAFAATKEVYLSDLRIIYAEDFSEAKEILSGTDFKDYKLLNENLNEGTKEIGVWLAYKTTTDIEDAITDLSIMQMDGGYKAGNYQAMINDSLEEYKKMGEKYESIIEYFNEALDEEYFLAELAHRQLNLYTVKTVGITDKPSFEGELLGDIFYDGIDSDELAEMFMEGNSYALNNIRSLLAMGVSYNEDGKTYMEKVAEAAEEMNDDSDVFSDEDYDDIAKNMVITLTTLRDMFKEFSAYEDELNFNDEEVTEQEIKYAEHKTFANMMRDVDYLDGKTLYDFVLGYNGDKSDYSSLYPLVAALNEGQTELVNLTCFYAVIRYSMASYPEEYLENEVKKLEEKYEEKPFNVYEGVDRTVFDGTFALTTKAYRADAYTDKNTLADAFFGSASAIAGTSISILSGGGGIAFWIWGAFEKSSENAAANAASEALKNTAMTNAQATYDNSLTDAIANIASKKIGNVSYSDTVNNFMSEYFSDVSTSGMTFADKVEYITDHISDVTSTTDQLTAYKINSEISATEISPYGNGDILGNAAQQNTANTAASSGGMATSTILFIAGGVMLLYSALMIGYTIDDYYNPTYEDIPLSMVDMIETQYGDRYVKYDVVREAEAKKNGDYAAGDLNAFEAQRWNALYYTKSYEAGKPLLADEFVHSTSNNKAKDGYTPVHRFGEEICYDLNKYNFSDKSPSIYLSVKQSKNDKSAVADVPEVVGSIFSGGLWMLFGGVGALFGVGGTLGTQALLKKKKTKISEQKA